MRFVLDIGVSLVVAGIVIGFISYIINVILRFIGLDIPIIKVALFLVAWYFVGPIVYNFLLEHVIVNQNDVITFIYKPVQMLMEILKV